MRKWSYLSAPVAYNSKQIHKVMVYETANEGTYVFLYSGKESQMCVADEWYEETGDALEVWEPLIIAQGWTEIGDPLPDCQHDCFLLIRVKGRNLGEPRWGEYEQLVNGSWIEYRQ